MRTIKIYGASDDLFEIDTDHRKDEPDEIGCYDAPAAVKITADGEMGGGSNGLIVFGLYAPGSIAACWAVGISQLDEDVPLPTWPMTWGTWNRAGDDRVGYSVMLTIEAPDNAKIEQVLPEST